MNSEGRQSEDELRNSEERHKAILQASIDGFWMLDPEGHLLEVNDSYCRMSGYSESELLAMSVSDLEAIESKGQTAAHIARIIGRGEDRFETRHRRKDGNNIDVEVSCRYCTIEGGRIILFLRDITGLRQAEKEREQFHKFFQTSADLMCIADPSGNFIKTNPAFSETLGYSEQELVAKPIIEFIHQDDRQETLDEIARQLQSGFSRSFRNRYICKNGSVKWLSWRVTYNNSEGIAYGTARDITDVKRAEEVLRESEKRMSLAMQAGHMGLYDLNVKTGEAVVNPEYSLMLGYDPAESRVTTSKWIERLHPDDLERVVADYHAYVNGEIPHYNVEFRQRTRDGGWKWILSYGRIMERDPDGTPRRMLGVHVDISERKRVEEALHESENRLRFALEGSNDGLWDVQMRSNTTYLSPRGWEILGYRPGEDGAVINDWSDLVHPEDLLLTSERLREHIEGLTPLFQVEQRLRMKSGEWKWVLTRGKVVARDADGTPLRITGTHTDLTEQKILQEQLGQAQKLESVGRLAGGVAHDFNNMLSLILGHAQLALRKEAVSPTLREHLDQIQQAAERSADIVRQLLAFARKQTVAPKVLDPNETVASMLKMLSRLIGEDIDLAWLPGEGVWPVRMDTAQIDQILVNLCVNARDSIAGIGRVSIETGNKNCDAAFCERHTGCIPGEYVLFTVRDDGCGMDKETVRMVFEPFFTTKGVGQGTGLGLATVYGIVKQNDGFIDVDSEPGRGTSFKIYLPRYQGKEVKAPVEGPLELAGRGKETVLMVEDEPAILELGKQILEMQGYRVLIAGTPGEAIRMAIEHTGEIHLLLTDVIMPEMDGRELAKKLLTLYPGLKRLFMSGYTADVIVHHGVLAEGVQFIQKPFSLDALTTKVRETLDQ
jgi:PAS domain S-box-containing protein